MSDRELLIVIGAIASAGAAMQAYTFTSSLLRQMRLARAERQARQLMKALASATIVAFRSPPSPETPAEDAPRVH
jgi:hypothetical protein